MEAPVQCLHQTCQGKVTQSKPIPVVSDYIKIPDELLNAQQHTRLFILQ